MANTQTNRIDWIDAAKGIGIILVLIGHCNIPDVNQYIYLFHMPLFYIISGFCWNIEKNRSVSFKDFAKKKFNSYIIPYFKIALICFVVLGIGGDLLRMGYGDEYKTQLLKYIFGIAIYSRGTTEWLPSCSPIWFLTALFFAELIFYWIMKQSRTLVFVAIAGILGFLCYLCGKVFPWNIDNALTAIPYLYVGSIARKYWSSISSVRYLPIMLLATTLIFFFGLLGGDYDGNNLADIHIRGLEAVLISICLLSANCKWGGGGHFSLSKYLGRNTLVLFGYNYAINACLHFVFPSIDHSWVMATIVVLCGFVLVLIVNRFIVIKKILI